MFSCCCSFRFPFAVYFSLFGKPSFEGLGVGAKGNREITADLPLGFACGGEELICPEFSLVGFCFTPN